MKPVVAGVLLALAMAGPVAAQSDPAALKRGEALVTRNCAGCHSVTKTGDSPRSGAPAFRTLGAKYPVDALEEALGEGIVSGHPDMPEFKFEAPDVGAIIAYLKSVQQR